MLREFHSDKLSKQTAALDMTDARSETKKNQRKLQLENVFVNNGE